MIVYIFIAGGDSENSLHQKRTLLMLDKPLASRVGDGVVERVKQADFSIHLAKQHQAAVAGDVSTLEIGD